MPTSPADRPWTCPRCGKRYRLRGTLEPATCPACKRGSTAGLVDANAIRFLAHLEAEEQMALVIAPRAPQGPNHRFPLAWILFAVGAAVCIGLSLMFGILSLWTNRESPNIEPASAIEMSDEDLSKATADLIRPFLKVRRTAKFDDPSSIKPYGRRGWRIEGRFDSQNAIGVFLQAEYWAIIELVPKGEGRLLGPIDSRDPKRPFVAFDDKRDFTLEVLFVDDRTAYMSPNFQRTLEKFEDLRARVKATVPKGRQD